MTLYFTKEHEWLRVEGATATVGITRHAADELGELVFIEARPSGTEVKAGESIAVVESVKAASDIYAPVDGEVLESNAALADDRSSSLVSRGITPLFLRHFPSCLITQALETLSSPQHTAYAPA